MSADFLKGALLAVILLGAIFTFLAFTGRLPRPALDDEVRSLKYMVNHLTDENQRLEAKIDVLAGQITDLTLKLHATQQRAEEWQQTARDWQAALRASKEPGR